MNSEVKAIIIIPAFEPSDELVSIVRALTEDKVKRDIIVVDDGSGPKYQSVFDSLKPFSVTQLTHDTNKGKGAALQLAFQFVLQDKRLAEAPGVVTADADGQHLPKDILKICRNLERKPKRFYIGSRDVGGEKVPLRSRFGNLLTRFIFNCLSEQHIPDTQSGLRGIPTFFLPHCLNEHLSGYDFELEMLLRVSSEKLKIKIIPIKTVYEPGNPSSHFNPLKDSIKIYFVFLRFVAVSVVSALLDFSIFFLTFYLFNRNILLALCSGRIISGVFNFTLNKKVSFQCHGSTTKSGVRYTTLAVCLAFIAYFMIKIIHSIHFNIFYAKLFGEALLFLISFFIQRYFIFNSK